MKNRNSKTDIHKWANDLKERTKELECLFGISKIIEKQLNIEDTMQKIAELIPRSWQYPEITGARITSNGKTYKTASFRKTENCHSCDIVSSGNNIGKLEVCLLKKKYENSETNFLKSEHKLLTAVSERIGQIIERKQIGDELERSHEKLRELFEHLENVREEERKNIAHDIHDELGHSLTALKMDIGLLDKNITLNADIEKIKKQTSAMTKFIDETINNVQRIALNLRPVLLDDFGLSAAVLWYTDDFEKRSGIKCKISVSPEKLTIEQKQSIMIFRIYQELLTNILRHAEAKNIEIKIQKKNRILLMNIQDNGKGITKKQIFSSKSFGLLGVRERINFWGGTVNIEGIPGEGTTIDIKLPVKNA